jgi:hypothetical protein
MITMRLTNKVAALMLIPMFLLSSPALADQRRIVDAAAMDQALAGKAETERTQREAVQRALDRDDVRQVAVSLGLSVADARGAVATLSGAELGTMAAQASAVEAAALSGGASTVTISLTVALLLLIIVILLVK